MSTTDSLTSPTRGESKEKIDNKLKDINPKSPFGNMALALSGGGFRASAFSLGALSYLNRCYLRSEDDTLLKHVTFLTSTSGGTLTNAMYSSSLFEERFEFKDFYKSMKDFIDGEKLLKEVFRILNDSTEWDEIGKPGLHKNCKSDIIQFKKSKNLINAFAKAYDNLLFKDVQNNSTLFDVYFNRNQNPHLKAVCFNATELNNGISFRFQTNGYPDSIRTVGNYYLQFNNPSVARKLKLSDIVATSSCFPSGFEPMIYPADFVHDGLTDIDEMLDAIDYKNNNPLELECIKNKPFSMVDGGVVDNQGLYSMMMEDDFRREKHPDTQFDLMMVCDVSSYFVKAFQTPTISDSYWGKLSINMLKKWLPLGIVVFLVSLLLATLTDHLLRRIGLFFLLTSGVYTCIYFYTLIAFNHEIKKIAANSIGKMLIKYARFFMKLPFNKLQQMLMVRLKSTIEISSDLFLKQIRRQYYNEFYNMPNYKNRTLSCLIYEFSAQHDNTRIENLETKDEAWWPEQSDVLRPSLPMQQIATNATNMSTTLWFDTGIQTMRDDIIACGQFTMCYNLLKHIYRLEVLHEKWNQYNTLQELKNRLLDDWQIFQKQPRFMV